VRILVVGSGFAGSILARVLHAQGHAVTLVDRARHPRFAIGESSTPLAALALERLAARYGLADLAALAAYGRWLRELPHLRRGLKRGFTFYAHRPGEKWTNDLDNSRRLLVAASPDDEVADVHWLRADVDAHLAARAAAEGIEVREETAVADLARQGEGWRCALVRAGCRERLEIDLVLDASGAGGFLGTALGLAAAPHPAMPATWLVGGHFSGVGDFAAAASERGAELAPGPYPDERAAVHHLLAEGWLYLLPFDHGVVSAGFVLRHDRTDDELARLAASHPARAWNALLASYPSLEEQLGGARCEVGIFHVTQLQRRWRRAAGTGWAMLPFAFCFWSPLFSTGIAWSLVGVERLARRLEPFASPRAEPAPARLFADYSRRLGEESDHQAELLAVAYALTGRAAPFFSWSLLYFAAASFAEAEQRLLEPPAEGWAWGARGFLGARDRVLRRAVSALAPRARVLAVGEGDGTAFAAAVRAAIAPRDVAGLTLSGRRNLYAVEAGSLLAGAARLGLSRAELERRLPRLRWAGALRAPVDG